MKLILAFILVIPLYAQMAQITDNAVRSPVDGELFRGAVTVEAAPACKMTRNGATYGQMQRKYCLGTTGSTCSVPSAAGVISLQLLRTDAGTTPAGCSYTARWEPVRGSPYTETWVVEGDGPYKINDLRRNTVPTPSLSFLWTQINWAGFGDGCLRINNGIATPSTCGSSIGSGTPWNNLTAPWDSYDNPWDET